MKITKDVVEHVAHLGRLELDPDEVELYTVQVDSILEYMDQLNLLDTEGIEPMSHPMPVVCVLRDDVAKDSFSVDASTQNAPEKKGSFFKVPPIIEID
ncbi:MAG: Asp-tRNA(Asn)/Glu-tRNA(Gln) amidotransferase subunit GatC [Proteobacteria bacterium]|nr:Asp-tRNA(Asn)/Glu-tRNA(Gln) amidotransferase subunit GatC [Pseudomonadota bacterium]